ncbi:MAG: hypothetical protein ABIN57_11845 [Chitinophagaceae bacterium]
MFFPQYIYATVYRYLKQHSICILFLLSALFIFINGNCQYNENKFLQVRFAPLNLFTPLTPTLQIGLQKRVNQRFALAADYGFRVHKNLFYLSSNGRPNYHYYTAKGEVKYFFPTLSSSKSGFSNPYISLQGFYLPQRYGREYGWLYQNNKSFQYDHSTISRNVFISSVLIGDEEVLHKIILDYYVGLGARRITIHHYNTSGAVERQRSFPADIGGGIRIDEKEGNFYRPHLAWGIKLGYILNNKQQPK